MEILSMWIAPSWKSIKAMQDSCFKEVAGKIGNNNYKPGIATC